MDHITREEAFELLKKYNQDPFHIRHALTVESVMQWYAKELGCGVTLDVAPEHEMEKVLFAADELTGLIWAAARMRPSKSTKDMELKSLKKKYKSKGFAAGCSREVIERGAKQLGWDLPKLLTMTLQAMADTEDIIQAEVDAL